MLKLKFEIGRKGTPISRLDSGKIVFPERGTTVEIDKYYVGEIIFEKDNFAIFRPIRMTKWVKIYKCGHTEEMIGGFMDGVSESEFLCSQCENKRYLEKMKEKMKEKEKTIAEQLKIVTVPNVFSGRVKIIITPDKWGYVQGYKAQIGDRIIDLQGGIYENDYGVIDRFQENVRKFLTACGYDIAKMKQELVKNLQEIDRGVGEHIIGYVCPICGEELEASEYVQPSAGVVGSVFNGQRWDTISDTSYISILKCPNGHGYFTRRGDEVEKETIFEKKKVVSFEFMDVEVRDKYYLVKQAGDETKIYEPVSITTRYYSRLKLKDVDIKATPANFILHERYLSRIVIDTPVADLLWFDEKLHCGWSLKHGLKIIRKGDERFTRLLKYKKEEK